jgi:hypothetical protein
MSPGAGFSNRARFEKYPDIRIKILRKRFPLIVETLRTVRRSWTSAPQTGLEGI